MADFERLLLDWVRKSLARPAVPDGALSAA